jgi:hypothetical protein
MRGAALSRMTKSSTTRLRKTASRKTASRKAPWDRPTPRKRAGKSSRHLTPKQKSAAKSSAERAGRHYPNLVDNMHVAAKANKKAGNKTSASKSANKAFSKKTSGGKTTTEKTASKTSTAKRKSSKRVAETSAKRTKRSSSASAPSQSREKNPRGGLTAAGRRAFAERDGSHLKPGVRKMVSEMSPAEMRRKGSWAVRFYGRAELPALVDGRGRPTRFALSAHAWGEPVPKTEAAARQIAAKGERLLQRYHRLKASVRRSVR